MVVDPVVQIVRNEQALIAIDPSLTASGWALFSVSRNQPLALGVVSPPGPSMQLACRLNHLQMQVEDLVSQLELQSGDILVCEGPAPLVLNPDSALKVERVRSIFESVARCRGISVPGRINPRTVQTELLGMRGRQISRVEVKDWARRAVERLYGDLPLKLPMVGQAKRRKKELPQDVVDALLIGSLAVSRVQLSNKSKLSLETVFESRGKKNGYAGGRRATVGWTEQDIERLNRKR